MTELLDLQTFVTAIRAGSFARAARQLGITPAMVGRRIQSLEDRHGTRLIERTTRRQRLTETGEAFLAQAETVLDAVSELGDIARSETGGLSGRIRLTGPATLGIHRLAHIVTRFCEANPAVTVEMSLNDRRADLIAEGFDLAIRIGELAASSLIMRPVGHYPLVCVAAPSYLAAHGAPTTPATLLEHRCILNLNMSPRGGWPFFGPGGAALVAEVRGGLQIDNGEAQRMAALAGAGIAYLPHELVADDLAEGTLSQVLSHWKTLSLPINIVYPSRRFVPRRLKAFMDAIAAGLMH